MAKPKPQLINTTVRIDSWDLEDAPLEAVLVQLREAAEGLENPVFYWDVGWENELDSFYIRGKRLETEAEVQQRVATAKQIREADKARKAAQEEQEKLLYEKLKAKFETEVKS